MWTVEIDGELYLELLDDRFNNGMFSPDEAAEALYPRLRELIEDCGVDPKNSDPKYIIDNYIVNGEFVYRENWKDEADYYYNKYDGDWQEFCENECLLYDDEYAYVRF